MAFSPDGSLVASASDDATVKVWRVVDGVPLRTLRGHTDFVHAVTFSSDGLLLVSGSRDDTIRVWRVADGTLVRTIRVQPESGPPGSVASSRRCMALSPDGAQAAWLRNYRVFGATNVVTTTVQLWQITDGTFLYGLTRVEETTSAAFDHHFGAVAFSPDGRLLAAGGASVSLWNVADGALLRVLLAGVPVQSIAFAPDGLALAASHNTSFIGVWQVETGTLVRSLLGHRGAVRSVTYSEDGTLVASAGWDSTIRVWQASDGALRRVIQDADNWRFRTVDFSPDNRYVATGTAWGRVSLFRVEDGARTRTFTAHNAPVDFVKFSSDESLVVSSARDWRDGSYKFWDVSAGTLLWDIQGAYGAITAFDLSPDGRLAAFGVLNGAIEIRSAAEGRLLGSWNPREGQLTSLAFSPDGTVLASGFANWTIKFWRLSDGTLLRTLTNYSGIVQSLHYSPDGRWLVSSSSDKSLKLWRADDGAWLQTWNETFFGFSADSSRVAVRRVRDGAILSRSVATGLPLTVWVNPFEAERAFCLSPDWDAVITWGAGVLQSWSFPDGFRLASFDEETVDVSSFTLSPTTHFVAFGRDDGSLVLARNTLTPLLSVSQPPQIWQPPQSQRIEVGGSTALWVGATSASPRRYQWFFNSVPIPEATNFSLRIGPVSLTSVGDYSVSVSNSAGATTSRVARLEVSVSPRITLQPRSTVTSVGEGVTLEVEAQGQGPLAYQWRLNDRDLPGETNRVLRLDGAVADQSGVYTVRVSQPAGAAVSAAAVVQVTTPVALEWTVPPSQKTAVVLAFSPDGTRLARGSYYPDMTTNLLESSFVADGRTVGVLGRRPESPEFGMAIAPGLHLAAYLCGNRVDLYQSSLPDGGFSLWRSFTLRGQAYPGAQLQGYSLLAFSPAADRLAIATTEGIEVWRLPEGTHLLTFGPLSRGVTAIVFSPDGLLLASVSALDNTVRLWRVSSGALLRTVTEVALGMNTAAFSPDGTTLAVGGNDATVKLWRVADGSLLRAILTPLDAGLTSYAFTPDGEYLCLGFTRENAQFIRLADGVVLPTQGEALFSVRMVAFAPDGARVALAHLDGSVSVARNPFAPGSPSRFRQGMALLDGRFHFSLDATLGQSTLIETSIDLQHWSTWSHTVPTNATVEFTDPFAGSTSHRFFRARSGF